MRSCFYCITASLIDNLPFVFFGQQIYEFVDCGDAEIRIIHPHFAKPPSLLFRWLVEVEFLDFGRKCPSKTSIFTLWECKQL